MPPRPGPADERTCPMSMGGAGMGGWNLMRSFRRDDAARSQRPVARARPPDRALRGALPPAAGRVPRADRRRRRDRRGQPADLRGDHRQRHPARRLRPRRRARAPARGARGRSTPACRSWQRWISARIGEGLIFDMRTQVFAPLPADADRVLHPDPDRRAREPPEQRRARRPAGLHRHPLVGGRQRHQRWPSR